MQSCAPLCTLPCHFGDPSSILRHYRLCELPQAITLKFRQIRTLSLLEHGEKKTGIASPLKNVTTLYPPRFPMPGAATRSFLHPPVPGISSLAMGFSARKSVKLLISSSDIPASSAARVKAWVWAIACMNQYYVTYVVTSRPLYNRLAHRRGHFWLGVWKSPNIGRCCKLTMKRSKRP